MSMRLGMVMVVALVLAGPRLVGAVPVCGNGAIEPPEVCDDGNLVDGDGCDSNCTPTGCGNGIVTAGEGCDDGNHVDGDCCSALCVNENLPPDCSAAEASVAELWPPNHKLVSTTVVGVTDPDGDPVTVSVTGIEQDEPVDDTGDGATCPDASGVGTAVASLRSERSGGSDGRTYHVAFRAVDRCGAACMGEVLVCVRHDRGAKGACADGGALYDSTAGVPPCEGSSCGPERCVPDTHDVPGCEDESVPAGVEHRVDRARELLGRHGKGSRLGRAAAKQLTRAARRAARAARHGQLSDGCATALAGALEGAGTCAGCVGEVDDD